MAIRWSGALPEWFPARHDVPSTDERVESDHTT
jgi:hypothetical protein